MAIEHESLDIVEYSAIEEWKRGKREPLVNWFAQQQGKVLSRRLHGFLLDVLRGKKGRSKGAPRKSSRDLQIKVDYSFALFLADKLRRSRASSKQRETITRIFREHFALSEQDPLPLSKTAIKEVLATRYDRTTTTRIAQIIAGKKKSGRTSPKN